MANAPSTSSYVLLASEPIDLPNGQVLTATPGLEIQSGGASGNVLISPSLGLDSIVQLNSSGIAVYNALTTTFTTTSLQTDGTLYINNQDGLDGPPTLGVLAQRTVQLVKGSANGGGSVGAYPELHFTGSGAASCSVTADAGNNRLVVNYGVAVGAAGEGTVTSVGLESSASTLTIGGTNPVTSSGVIDVNLPAFGVAGTYMNPQLTLDDYGRVIGASSGSGGNGTVTSVGLSSTNGSLTVSGSPVTTTGTMNVQMPATGVAAGTYSIPTISVDGFGRITSAANGTAISTITGTNNQITASTVSGNTTLSIPSDFRVPGTLTFPNTTPSQASNALSYYSFTSINLAIGWNGPSTVNTSSFFERIGNTVTVYINSVNITCNVIGTSQVYIYTEIPSGYIQSLYENTLIGTGTFNVYNSGGTFLYNLPFAIIYAGRGQFWIELTALTTFNGSSYTSTQPNFINGQIYNFGQNGNFFGLNFTYKITV